jgi:hypothetical protein
MKVHSQRNPGKGWELSGAIDVSAGIGPEREVLAQVGGETREEKEISIGNAR